jgi:glycosyltransferase involved in cell wall biosynthesis
MNIHIYPSNMKNESRILKETESLQKAGFFREIWLVGLMEDGLPREEVLDNTRKIIRLGQASKNRLGVTGKILKTIIFWKNIFSLIKNKKVKVIQIHNLSVLPLGVVLKLWKKAKLVYDAHELETERVEWGRHVKEVSKIVEGFFIKFADETIVVSEEIAAHYRKLYPKIDPVTILNAPHFTHIQKKNYFREKFGIREDQKIYIYQGCISENRGLELILDAFKELESDDDVIIFMGYGELVPLIEEAAKMYKHIFFQPAVSPQDVMSYTSSADYGVTLMVFPDACLSYYYCLPNKLFEYCMAGLPIITSNAIEMRRFVEKNDLGVVVEEKNVSAVKAAIQEIKKLSYEEKHAKCLKVAGTVSWEVQEKILLDIYKKIL